MPRGQATPLQRNIQHRADSITQAVAFVERKFTLLPIFS